MSAATRDLMDDVATFHRMSEQPVVALPKVPSGPRVHLRAKLILEECLETLHAMGHTIGSNMQASQDARMYDGDIPELADGLADLIYVCIGTALEFGIPLDRVWAAVQHSNMAKAGPDGKCQFRADGKLMKPEWWCPPDIRKAIYGD